MSNKRISKKRHKYWLDLAIIDASQYSYWRCLLFDSKDHEEFLIDREHVQDFPQRTVDAIRRFNLKYKVKVTDEYVNEWFSESGLVMFKFWASDFPSVKMFSGNNPDVR